MTNESNSLPSSSVFDPNESQIEATVDCSCPHPDTAGCDNCHSVRFRHEVVCIKGSPPSSRRRLCHFGPKYDCAFCTIISNAFIRRLEASGKKEILGQVRGGYRYQNLDAEFLVSKSIIAWDDKDTGSQEKSSNNHFSSKVKGALIEAQFHEQIIGDNGGEASLGSAFFHVSWTTESLSSAPLTQSKTNQEPNRFSSLRPILGPFVDWSLIKKWIYECEHNHLGLCNSPSTSEVLERPRRVVDVHNNCIVNLQPNHEYVTLSYVWGIASLSKKILTASTSNFLSLIEIGALSKQELPKTIEHAMEVCRRIGQRYLWVDSLCIIQDDQNDVTEQLARMSDIYSGSFLTIIAASGENAEAGLPGVSNGISRDHQKVGMFDGLEIIEVLPLLGDVLQLTSWMSRAWTQQEWILSPRRLYFTKVQMYFECKTALRNEDAWAAVSGKSNDPPQTLGHHERPPLEQRKRSYLLWPQFQELLGDYTRRHLSYSNDIFNACTGLYHYVYGRRGSRLVFGLPEQDFCDALRWHSYQYTPRVPESTEFVIPSWSWGSTKAKMGWLGGDGWQSDQTSDGPRTIPLIQFEVCAEKDGTWKILKQSIEDERTKVNGGKHLEYPTPISHHVPTPGRLRFRTQSAMFRLHGKIGYFDLEKNRNYLELEIGQCDGGRIATINVDLEWGLKHANKSCVRRCWRHRELRSDAPNSRKMVQKMYENGWNQCKYVIKPQPFKFIITSAINLPQSWTISTLERYVKGNDLDVKDEVDTFLRQLKPDSFYRTPGDWKDLHVILIEESKDKDTARRIGITNLRLDDWLKSGPVMEDIVLE